MGATTALPERFGKYHVLSQLARTAADEVYRVKTVGIAGFEKVQVLKRILPPWSRDPMFIRTFLDEARTAVALNHRNIVQVFDFGRLDTEGGDELFLAMELVDGVDLSQLAVGAARTGAPMPAAVATYLLAEVAAGLDYAHKKADPQGRLLGVAHCDLTPRHVMISYEGYVKILDFALGRALLAVPTQGRRPRGSPPYVAPEVQAGDAPSSAADIYALGVIACELLSGLPPDLSPDPERIRERIQPEAGPDGAARRDVFEPLAEALALALTADPRGRRSAGDLGGAFSRAHRTLDPGVGSRALARFIAEVFPPREPSRSHPAIDVTMPGHRGARPSRPPEKITPATSGPITTPAVPPDEEDALEDDENVITAPGSGSQVAVEPEGPVLLGEKRRVVAAACRLEGANPDRRGEAARIVSEIAYKHGAVVEREDAEEGDWLTVLFGLEQAGEDDVAEALRFALDAADSLRDLAAGTRPGGPGRVALRIGVRQGMARRRAGESRGGTALLLGDALEEARAMALSATPGKTLLGGGAGRLAAAHYGFRELPPLKRRARRVRVQELLGPRPPEDHRRHDAFFGREQELTELDQVYDAARSLERRLFSAIVGEAGIGKSRLVAEFAERVAPSRPIRVTLAAAPGDRHAPYALIGDVIAAALGLPHLRGATGRGRLVDRLRQTFKERGPPATEPNPEAAETLATVDLVLRLRDGDTSTPTRSEAERGLLRDRVVAALAALRGLDSSPRPRLTILEDWQWVDAPSADVFQVLFRAPADAGAELVILTARPDDRGLAPFPAQVSPILRLGELDESDRRALARDRLSRGSPPALDAAVAAVERRAGGNPLFIEELASAVSDLGPGELPESARGVIAARVDRLPSAAKAVLQYAAVLGAAFRPQLLEELLGKGVHGALRLLEERGLLATQADGGPIGFRHGLIQEVVYEALSGGARRDAHRRVGLLCAMRHDAGRSESAAQVARHLELGGEESLASAFFLDAGKLALAAWDATAAAAAFTRALELGGGEDREKKREAVAGRERALFHLGDHAAQLRDLETLARLSADDPGRLADVSNRAAMRHLRLGELAAAVADTESAERTAGAAHDERLRGEALRLRAEAFERQASFDAALESVTRALEIFRAIGAGPEETRALLGLGRIHLMCSRYDAALTHYQPALEQVRASGDVWVERILRNNLAVTHLGRGEYTEAYDNAMRAVDICRRYGDRAREGDNCSVAGSILLELGRYEEARDWMQAGLAIHAETGSRWSRGDALVYAGCREIVTGQLEQAFRYLDEAIAIGREIGARYIVANAKNQLALALIARRGAGDLPRAAAEASEGAALGHELALPSCEIQGLSRSALARLEHDDPLGALVPSMKAVQALDRVRTIEWSEEEILFTHYRVLKAVGDSLAMGFLARAYAGLMAKLARIGNRDWQKSFADDVDLHRRIREEHARASRL